MPLRASSRQLKLSQFRRSRVRAWCDNRNADRDRHGMFRSATSRWANSMSNALRASIARVPRSSQSSADHLELSSGVRGRRLPPPQRRSPLSEGVSRQTTQMKGGAAAMGTPGAEWENVDGAEKGSNSITPALAGRHVEHPAKQPSDRAIRAARFMACFRNT
jgi:hypothetical protein